MENPNGAAKLRSLAFQDGLPAAARWVREGILALDTGGSAPKKAAAKRAGKAAGAKKTGRAAGKSAAKRKVAKPRSRGR
jgi:hypothetical protein